ncbi:unnamed protein product [Rhizophagus irregularis]|nr:unnamed protein product [Rhizophagus irregularis]
MDKTPLAFNFLSNTTVEQSGTGTISTLSTGYEYANFTVVLACGLTSRLQPLDVSLNKLFKDKMHHYYYHWMSEEIKEYKSTEKIKKPSYSLVANWAFVKFCGTSNAINGGRVRGIEEDGENYDESSNNDYEPDDNSESDSSECELEDNYYCAMYFRIGINIEFLVK